MNIPRLLLATLSLFLANGHAAELSQEKWGDMFTPAITNILCRDKSYFRHCFATSSDQCEKEAISATRICLKDLSSKLPKTFTSREQSVQAGNTVGQCAGTTMELSLLRRKISDPKCSDPNAWK